MRTFSRSIVLATGLLAVVACGEGPATPATATQATPAASAEPASPAAPDPAAAPPSAPQAGEALPPPDLATSAPAADAWLGKWIGPEGTFLELSRADGGYDVLVQSLDGPAHYAGVPVDAHVEFTRAGKRESIQATDGAGTGMKWLADKHDCLVIQPGEGFCRD